MCANAGGEQPDLSPTVRADLAARFAFHGRHIYGSPTGNSSPFYAALSLAVADDPAILALVAEADRATQVPNLLFAAVHYLLLGDTTAPLAAYYPDFMPSPLPRDEAYPAFRAYCLAHAEAIRELVTTRRVQTNEVGRCAALLPAFAQVAARGDERPLALVEIGASAGLLMAWDHYGYAYRMAPPSAPVSDVAMDDTLVIAIPTGDIPATGASELRTGKASSPVQIATALRGECAPTLPARMPDVAYRVGLDLYPIDARDEDATRWLRALIWPEHADRRQLLEAALELARADPPHLVQGDAASSALTDLLEQAPPGATLCVYHSYTLNQMPAAIREQTLVRIADFARQHPERAVYRVSQEWFGDQPRPEIRLFTYEGDEMRDDLLAYAESHGRWLEWLHIGD